MFANRSARKRAREGKRDIAANISVAVVALWKNSLVLEKNVENSQILFASVSTFKNLREVFA